MEYGNGVLPQVPRTGLLASSKAIGAVSLSMEAREGYSLGSFGRL